MVQKCKFPGKSATIRNVLGLKSQIVTILGILSAKIYDWLIRYWFKHLHPVFSAHGSICTSATEESQNLVHNQFKMTHRPPGAVSSSTVFFDLPKKNYTFVSQITRFSTRNLPKQKRAMPCPTQKALDVAPQVAKRAAEIGRLNINHAVSSRKKCLVKKHMIKKTLARRGVSV